MKRFAMISVAVVALICPTRTGFAQQEPPPAPQPSVVPPRLIEFHSARYPSAAQSAGVEGDVVLRLSIDAGGKVQSAEVVEPAGQGFDEAAREAALQFVFEPATRDGKPVAARILYKYSFTLTEATPERAAPGAGPGATRITTGELAGKVEMRGGGTVAGVEVVVRGPDGLDRRATTDEGGRWRLEKLPPGTYAVRVAAQGFEAVVVSEEVAAGESTEVVYRLAPVAEAGSGAIEVTVVGERPPREVTRRTLEQREIARIPGTSGDALRSIQSLPGVSRPPPFAGLLIVRGSAPDDTAIFIDGANVPLLYHFGGLSSVVPTELIERIDFYPGNFSARYGRVTGGIVDVALRSPDTRCNGPYGRATNRSGCYHGLAQIDLIDTRLLVQGPLGPVKGWTFAAGVRRSWVDLWLKPVLESADAGVTAAPVYYDYQVMAETKPAPRSKLSARFFGSDDRLELLIKQADGDSGFSGGNIDFHTGFWIGQLVYEGEVSRDLETSAMLGFGQTRAEFSFASFLFDVTAYPVTVRSELGWRLARAAKLNLGMDLSITPFDIAARFPQPSRPGEPDPGPFTTRPPIALDRSGIVYRPGWYAEGEIVPVRRVKLIPGFRIDKAWDAGGVDLSPRIAMRYDIVEADASAPAGERALRTTLKGGIGLFHQPPEFLETDEQLGTPGLRSARALHYSIGVEQELSRQIELSVEGFYKDLERLVSRVPGPGGRFAYANEGAGRVFGAETLLKYKPDRKFFGWIAYTLSRSVRTDGPGERERLFEWDQTHNLTMLGSYRLGRGWEIGSRFRLVSGRLYTPLVRRPASPAVYAADAATYTPLEGEPYSERLPLFHALDVRVDKHWQFRDWKLSAYLDVQNVYNHQAVEDYGYNFDYTRRAPQRGLPILPSLGLRGEL